MLASHDHHHHTHSAATAFDDGTGLAKDLSTVSEASERSSLSDLVDVKSSSSSSAGSTWKIKKMPKPKVREEGAGATRRAFGRHVRGGESEQQYTGKSRGHVSGSEKDRGARK